jgi:PTS system mannose-specific IIB component
MIHGQVAIAWSKALEIRYLVVANDACAASSTQTMALKMAGPPSCKTQVQTIEGCIKTLNDPRSHDLVISIIVTNLEDALKVAQGATGEIKRINFGNYGRLKAGNLGTKDKKKLSDNVYIDEEDIQVIQAIRDTGIPVDVQLLPYLPMVTIEDVLK